MSASCTLTPFSDKTNVGWTGTPQKWQAPLRVRPSAQPYSLSVSTGAAPEQNATVQFGMARRSVEAVALTLDDEGKVTRRVLGGNRVQDLTWDGLGRLVRVIEHLVAASSSVSEPSYAYRWTARYDGLGRRVLAKTEWGWLNTSSSDQTFTPGLIGAGAGGPPTTGLSTRATVVEESFHDPLVEFLEIAVETRVIGQGTAGNAGYVQASRTRAWKVHGPDANGAYGGLQGIGGLEAVYEERAVGTVAQAPSWTGVIDDYYGHIVATVAGEVVNETTLRYHETKSIGYGPAPDSPVHYLSEGASLTQSTAWRGKRQDITGFYYLGARYYEPSSARFLSTDPMGHGASMSLYDYAGGDPINFVDPTGRLQTSMLQKSYDHLDNFGTWLLNKSVNSNNMVSGGLFGMAASLSAAIQGMTIGALTIADQWSFHSSDTLHNFTTGTGFDSAYTRGAANIAGGSLAAIGGVAAGTAAWGFGAGLVTDTAAVINLARAGTGIGAALSTPAGQRLVQTGSSGFEMGMEMLSGYAGPSMSAMGGLVDDVVDAGRTGMKNLSVKPYWQRADGAINPSRAAAQLAQNQLTGKSAEMLVKNDYLSQGFTHVGEQVRMEVQGGGIRFIDHLFLDAQGELMALEVKAGNSLYNLRQVKNDMLMETIGARFTGGGLNKQFEKTFTNQSFQIPTTLIRVP